jgi:hypothetical protein
MKRESAFKEWRVVKKHKKLSNKRKMPNEFELETENKKLKTNIDEQKTTITSILVKKLEEKNKIILNLERELSQYKIVVKKFMYSHSKCSLEYLIGT